jgi:hypothetical protein
MVDGRKLEIFSKLGYSDLAMFDAETGSEWDFNGRAINGQLNGRQLKRFRIERYWFDRKNYHLQTFIYDLGGGEGSRRGSSRSRLRRMARA